MQAVCSFVSGGDFRAEHVQWLAKQVPGLICITTEEVPGVTTIKPRQQWPSWWCKMNHFDADLIPGDLLMLDLDTVVLRMPDVSETTVLENYVEPGWIGSGFMYVTEADRRRVWDAWIADPDRHMRDNTRWPRWGDQGFLQDYLGESERWGDNVRSYKVHCRASLPDGVDVVVFHGNPRPWNVRESWVPRFGKPDFRDLVLSRVGKRAIILGGGPSLERDIERLNVTDGDLVLSCNGHGAHHRHDYAIAIDCTHTALNVPMRDHIRSKTDAPIIAPHSWADVMLGDYPLAPAKTMTGLVAIWAAYAMGASVICPCGFDGYPNQDYKEMARKVAMEVKSKVHAQPDSVVADVFDTAESAEAPAEFTPDTAISNIKACDGTVRVRCRKPCKVGMFDLQKGDEATVYRVEARLQLKHKMIEEI